MNTETVHTLIDAAKNRHSVRNFLPDALPEAKLAEIDSFINSLDVPFNHTTQIRRFLARPGKKLYNNGINGPDNIVILGQTDHISISKAGFCGQLVMLKLTSMGINTCWFGHYKLPELAGYIDPELATPERIKETTWKMGYGYGKVDDAGERAICCIACGIVTENAHRLVDIVAGRNGIGRKPLTELLEADSNLFGVSENIIRALDVARLAPSAANSQMWRFGIYDEGKTLTVAKPVGYKHFKWEHPDVDIGICAAHLWLGLLAEGYNPGVTVMQDEDRAKWIFSI